MIQDRLQIPVFVTGIERSGASIIAKVISICGGFTGKTNVMHENYEIKKLVDGYYSSFGINPNGQYPLLDTKQMLIPSNWRTRIENILFDEKYDGSKVWMYKSSRISQMWPVWNYAFPNARWIIVRRRTGDIIESCLKTKYMNAFENEVIRKTVGADNIRDGWLWWVHEHEKLFIEMIETGLNCKVVWPERMVYGDYYQINEMLDWLGLSWNKDIVNMIDPLLENSTQKERRAV